MSVHATKPLKPDEIGKLCARCQQEGLDPELVRDICRYCRRTAVEIIGAHGRCLLTPVEKKLILVGRRG